jgi:hypothetical protein
MLAIFAMVAVLLGWALYLMQKALHQHEFSLLLAGFLVASSAAALVMVYFLMSDYAGYLSCPPDQPFYTSELRF